MGQFDRDDVRVKGNDGTDEGAIITVTPDGSKKRLDVSATFSSTSTNIQAWSKKLRLEDMNAGTGGIARNTNIATSASWTNIYSYSGSGYLGGFLINIETFTGWEFRLQVDSETIFSLSDSDLATDTLYDVDDVADVNQAFLGISKGGHDRLIWHPPLEFPLYYASNVTISIRRPTAGAKKFQAGLVVLSKES